MLRCVQTICASVRERPMCFTYMIKLNFVAKTRSVDFICLITVFICLASGIVGFGYFSIVKPLK